MPEIIFSYSSHHGVPFRPRAISMICASFSAFAMMSIAVSLPASDGTHVADFIPRNPAKR